MENQIQLLKTIIQTNIQEPTLKSQIHNLKIQVFTKLAENSQQYGYLALQFCEVEVLYTLLTRNLQEFELAIERLITFYNGGLQSQDQYHFIGIYLIYLLSFNKFPQYYSQIELLPKNALSHPFLAFVIQLEYKLSIGSYSNLLEGYQPTGVETVFLERIMDTIRLQTALSANASYTNLSINNALKLLNINSIQELQQYAVQQGFQWKFDQNYVYFDRQSDSQNALNADFLISNQLRYIHEFDKII